MGGVPVSDVTVQVRELDVEGDGVVIPVQVRWTGEPSPHPILLLHTKRGINDHTIALADRLVRAGRTVMIPDLLARVGGSGRADRDAAPTSRGIPREWLVDDLRAVLDAVSEELTSYTAIGFSYGGALVWRLADHDPRCTALVDVRGRPPAPDQIDVSDVSCLVILAEGDDDDKRADAERILATSRHGHLETVTIPADVTGEDRRDLLAQESAWKIIEDWVDRHL
jgi:dienelactone hydrolase